MSDKVLGSVMVVGGGIAGMQDLPGSLPIRFEVQLPEEAARARTAYAEVTDADVVAGIISTYRDEPGNLLPVLLDINRRFNWPSRPGT